MTPTLDEQISYLLEEKDRTHLDIARGNAHRVAMFEAVIATLRAVKQAEPEGWVLRRSDVNEPQTESINELIARTKRAHYTDVRLRINGEYEFYQADWIKHLAAAPAAHQSGWRDPDALVKQMVAHGINKHLARDMVHAWLDAPGREG